MKIMGVYELAGKSYRELSGGQQQRVLLARALCAAKKIILLDEPTSGLDPTASASLYSLIQHLNKHMGITVIMVTHDIENAMRYANRVLRMGKTPRFFEDVSEYLKENYLGGGR
jgi:zinc transport system ATP-binding protein